MAEFKRALGSSDGGVGPLESFGVDHATWAAMGDASTAYWPLIVGAVILVLLLLRGEGRVAIPLAGGAMLLQAWQSGLLH